MKPKECENCDNYTDDVCCNSRPAGVLSTAFNYFVKPVSEKHIRSDELAESDEIQRKCGQGTTVIKSVGGC